MKSIEVMQAWGRILSGRPPSISIEITKECPLRCPGCYAYEDAHLGGEVTLRQLSDSRGDQLIEGVLDVARRLKPLHISIVGGDPLVRFRELEVLLPALAKMNIHMKLVTSAFRPIPIAWAKIPRLQIVVSVDGLPAEHDLRRKPATYDRILKHIAGHSILVHCTVTGQMMKREGYLDEFLDFWSRVDDVSRIWVSLFTPQKGAVSPECLTKEERARVVADLLRLREIHKKLDMGAGTIREFIQPPSTPADCIFARTTLALTADLKTVVTPCQFGGDPDCEQCGCMASVGMSAVGHTKLFAGVTLKQIFEASSRVGILVSRMNGNGAH
jgi:MoaA/NifB/PqqE/SkfB family radical SAM enzyme